MTAEPAADQPAVLPLRPRQVLTVAGAADNVFRVLQTLPGVAATEEFGSRLSVRGGTPDQNLTVMDGVEIHNPYRLFGLTSAFNPETVERFELTAGGFGAKYGDRLSSLLVVENRPGTRERGFDGLVGPQHHRRQRGRGGQAAEARPGLLAADGAPHLLRPRGRALRRRRPARRSTTCRAASAGSAGGGRWLSVSGIRSREDTDATFEDDDTPERGDFVTRARNDLASARFHAPFGARLTSETVAAWYRNTDALDVNARVQNSSQRTNAPGDDAYGLADVIFDREISVRDLSLRQDLAYRARPAHAGDRLRAAPAGHRPRARDQRRPQPVRGQRLQRPRRRRPARRARLVARLDARRRLAAGPGAGDRGPDGGARPAPRLERRQPAGDRCRRVCAASLRLDAATRLRVAGGLFTQSPGYEKLLQSDYLIDLTGRPRARPGQRARRRTRSSASSGTSCRARSCAWRGTGSASTA